MKKNNKIDLEPNKKNEKKKVIFKLTESFDSDYFNFLKENEEEKSILNSNFTKNKNKEKESFGSLLKTKIKIINQSNNNHNKDNDNLSSIYSTLKIEKEKEKLSIESSSSNTGTIISKIKEGSEIGSYTFDGAVKIYKLLGEGAQAKVYLGITENDNEDDDDPIGLMMAIKHFCFGIEESNIDISSEIDELVNKCQILKELSHDNIIQYFDSEYKYNEENNNFEVNIAMEYQETNLSDFMKYYFINNKVDNLPIDIIRKITKDIIEGLIYLHEHKIIHRDLKPENILMSFDYKSVKIGDFGISLWIKQSQSKMKNKIFNHTRDFMKRSVAGTGIYMSPEVLLGKPYGYDCDIWSLGCIVFEMAGGIKPFCTNEKDKKVPSTDLELIKYNSPLEIADENVKDIIYNKKNRLLLDFLLNCWRGNNVYRPSAKELLNHPFLNKLK